MSREIVESHLMFRMEGQRQNNKAVKKPQVSLQQFTSRQPSQFVAIVLQPGICFSGMFEKMHLFWSLTLELFLNVFPNVIKCK